MFEINDDPRGTYNTNGQIRFKATMLNLSLCDYSDAYIFGSGTTTVSNTKTVASPNNRKNVIIKNCVL